MSTLKEVAVDGLGFLKAVESSARTYADAFPILVVRGKDSKVIDAYGNEYIDCLAGAGTLALGHNNAEVLDAIRAFLDSGHVMHGLDLATPAKVEFTRKLLECFPPAFRAGAKVQFCGPTGADAVEAAVKLFKTATKRSSIIAFHGAYHGMTHGTLSMTGNLKPKQEVHGLMPDVHFFPFPYAYRCPFGLAGNISVDVGLSYIQSVLGDPESGIVKPAAAIVEIVQGEGGCIPAEDRWVRGLRDITRQHGIPLIVDEIQTGFGRTGHMFAFESSGIVPDAVVVSKAIGGGLPLSAVVYNEKYDVWRPGAHAGTFRGNGMAMAAGVATLKYIADRDLVRECGEKGDFVLRELREIQKKCAIVGDVRGRGLMIGIEIVDPTLPRDSFGRYVNSARLTKMVRQGCFDRGVIVECGGRHCSVLRLLPPLNISMSELRQVVHVLGASLLASAKVPNATLVSALPHAERDAESGGSANPFA